MPLLIFLFEFLVFFYSLKLFGFLGTMALYLTPSLIGVLVLSWLGKNSWVNFQKSMMENEKSGTKLDEKILAQVGGFVGSILLIIPTFTTRFFGFLLVIPWTRRFFIFLSKLWIFKSFPRGAFIFHSASTAHDHFRRRSGNFRNENGDEHEGELRSTFRDVTGHSEDVVDITPLQVETKIKKNPSEGSES